MFLIIAVTAAVPNQAIFENSQVNITVNVQSNIYTYKIKNLTADPVVGFEINEHVSYNFKAPQGWQIDTTSGLFRTWTTEPSTAIAKGQTAEFSLRVSSKGAVLGSTNAKIELLSGKSIVIKDVWTPVPQPRSYFFLIAGVFLLILLLHIFVVARKHRKKQKNVKNA